MCGVFKKGVLWVEHCVGQEEEEFARNAAIIKALFAGKFNHETLLKVLRPMSHNFGISVVENAPAANSNMALPRKRPHLRLRPEVNEFPTEVALVLRHVLTVGNEVNDVF